MRQNGAVVSPIQACRQFVVMKKWGMNDALVTLQLTSSSSEDDWSFTLDEALAIRHPYNQFYAIANWLNWVPDMDFKCFMGSSDSCIFIAGPNVKAFVLPPQKRGHF